MKIEENKVKVQRTGVYFSSGSESAKNVWFLCHGYAQLGDRMIKKFDRFDEANHQLYSVEAMNRFYWEGVTGNPVATWMTKRFRLDEIGDNNTFLRDIYNKIPSSKKRIVFGFSQGATTLWRWIHACRPEFEVFVNYAGWIPEDIDLSILKDYLKDKLLIFCYGTSDQYLTEERFNALQKVAESNQLTIVFHRNAGGHSIDRDVLDDIYQTYIH